MTYPRAVCRAKHGQFVAKQAERRGHFVAQTFSNKPLEKPIVWRLRMLKKLQSLRVTTVADKVLANWLVVQPQKSLKTFPIKQGAYCGTS
jgi:hypothetical protein